MAYVWHLYCDISYPAEQLLEQVKACVFDQQVLMYTLATDAAQLLV